MSSTVEDRTVNPGFRSTPARLAIRLPQSAGERGEGPVWRQLAGILRQRIADGTYPPGTAIPSLVKLTEKSGVAEVR